MTGIINKDRLLIIILLVMMHKCFDLFAMTDNFFGIQYSDILFLYSTFFIVYYYMKYPKHYFSGRFSKIIFLVPILIILSALMAKLFYNQNFILGILTQRAWLITMFLYFPFRALIVKGKLTLDIFWKILYLVVGIEASIYLMQYIVGADHYFLKVPYTYRYESIRIVADMAFMHLVLMHAVSEILKKVNFKKNIFFLVLILMYVFLVNKGRGEVIICLILIAGIILLNKASHLYKTAIIVAALLLGFNFIMQSTAVGEFTSILLGDSKDPTYDVRERSQEFYIEKLNANPLAWIYGYGMQNTTLVSSQEETGINQGYLITDNGIYGFLFSYGIFGLVWYIYSLSAQLRAGWILFKKKRESIVIVKILKDIIFFATNIGFFYSYQSLYSVLFFVLIELFFKDIKSARSISEGQR